MFGTKQSNQKKKKTRKRHFWAQDFDKQWRCSMDKPFDLVTNCNDKSVWLLKQSMSWSAVNRSLGTTGIPCTCGDEYLYVLISTKFQSTKHNNNNKHNNKHNNNNKHNMMQPSLAQGGGAEQVSLFLWTNNKQTNNTNTNNTNNTKSVVYVGGKRHMASISKCKWLQACVRLGRNCGSDLSPQRSSFYFHPFTYSFIHSFVPIFAILSNGLYLQDHSCMLMLKKEVSQCKGWITGFDLECM